MSQPNSSTTPTGNQGAPDGLRTELVRALVAVLVGLLLSGGLIAVAVLDFSRFPRHFVEQDSWQLIFLLGGGAAVYLGIVAGLVLALGAPLGGRALLVATTLSLATFVLVLTLFEAAALYFREDPPGGGVQRRGSDHDSFASSAERGFLALYTVMLALAAVIGRVLRSWQTGAFTLATVALFMLLSFPVVEFLNECNIGRPVLLSGGRC